ncbi:hypothetical protein, partial [Seinonella peptonophila]|uniref:hypothetical protein n=1 Tax=Seinonella peptonophila TaxID=112248 RepID=UPI001C31C254
MLRQFVKWRNDSIGHGRISNNIETVKNNIDMMYNKLKGILETSRIFLDDLSIFSMSPSDKKQVINWNIDKLIHSDYKPMVDWDYSVWVKRNSSKKMFSISPFIISKLTENQNQDQDIYTLLTFDKIRQGFIFLDCFYGNKVRLTKLPELEALLLSMQEKGKLKIMDQFSGKDLLNTTNSSYSSELIRSFDVVEFGSDNKEKYLNPNLQIEFIESTIEKLASKVGHGYLHITGKSGIGKSWMAHALKNEKYFQFSNGVIKYHIRLGMRQNPEVFIYSVSDQIRDENGHNVQARIQFEKYLTKSEAVNAFFQEVLEKSQQEFLILVIDGLDELLDSKDMIIDYLPKPNELVENVFIILLSRGNSELRHQSFKFIERVKEDQAYKRIDLDQFKRDRELLFKEFLTKKCALNNEQLIENIIQSSNDSFLMISLLGKVYAEFDSTDLRIPSNTQQAYTNYLDKLKQSTGESIFDKVYLKVLLTLALSPTALKLEAISDLSGIQEEKVVFTLYDIGDFFQVIRDKTDNYFSISHIKFIEYLLLNYQNEAQVILTDIVHFFSNQESIVTWLIECNQKLQSFAATRLSIYLSELLVELVPKGTKDWLEVMYSYIDMIHITGDYFKAAQMYHKLAEELIRSYGYNRRDETYIRYKMREAHHLKFVAPIDQPELILQELLSLIDDHHDLYNDICFGIYGSIGCLKKPDYNMLKELTKVAKRAKRNGNIVLYVKCLRRIIDLYLITGQIEEANKLITKAIQLAEPLQSRQRIYLYSTEGEIYRLQGKMEQSLVLHNSTLEYAKKLGLNGWAGHGALGLAETYRMIGNEQEAKRNVQLAYSYYRQASNQPWGTIHTMITDYFLSKKSNLIQNALRMS